MKGLHIVHAPLWVKLLFVLVLAFYLNLNNFSVNAETTKIPAVLVVYSTESGHMTENQNFLDMLIGHFTTNITFKSSKEVQEKDLKGISTLFYYGEAKEPLSPAVAALFSSFSGTIVGIGHNTEQLGEAFSFFQRAEEGAINELVLVNGNKKTSVELSMVLGIKPLNESKVLINGIGNGKTYPLFVKNKSKYYFAAEKIDSTFSLYLGEVLHDVFNDQHAPVHPAYIRLEDIHPLADPDILKGIADFLKEKNIPYIVSVIPIHRDPVTGKESKFSDYPYLLKMLKYLEENGGSIIVHGYTHQYKDDETGEGFEFWDVDANMPITVPADKTPEKKTSADFKSEEEYIKFLSKQKAFEIDYIKTKVTKAVQELVSYGLQPLAFEAPHYTMSQSGYEILADHFSTYIGQLQLGDRDWRIMGAAPYVTKPSFLHGMTLLPETIGFVDPKDPVAIDKMMGAADQMQVVRDGYIAGFYHPYLGVEKFKELIGRMERLPNLSWIDLKKVSSHVTVDNISVTVGEKEGVSVGVDYFGLLENSPEFYKPKVESATNMTMWMIAIAAGSMVALFTIFAIRLRLNRSRLEGGDFYG
ncbi:polysaccharide deacetylase family protein [Bacillus sp. T33-2]|uniref:polysaccharide deacetylase family protein n=1 Tax=Bacillus sp. T33-2 TaxID=2054168 RepID=UPI000C75F984|nr:polysaccharide deacetylase family protein [Bacillus sp. T33-2]PLR96049.1 hypothetical protein CVD19_12095 [Bacillus sp. T33-2]